MELKVGCDPELWIFDRGAGKIISAHGLFPGTKSNPHPVSHGFVQVDGMAAEFNIIPAKTEEQFASYIISVLRDLRDLIKKHNPHLDFEFIFSPVAEFGSEYINSQPLEAKQLGCTPDYNAYTDGGINPTPDAEVDFRTASGHIHIGWGSDYDVTDPEHIEACCMMVKQMDIYVGNDSNFAPAKLMLETQRRELYGKAGAFRPKSYGVEYRTPSNAWLNNLATIEHIFIKTKTAFHDLLGGYRAYNERDGRLINEGFFGNWFSRAIFPYKWNRKISVDTLDDIYNDYCVDMIIELKQREKNV